MYLEPDEENGHAYLQAVSYAKSHYTAKTDKYKNRPITGNEAGSENDEIIQEKVQRYKLYWQMLDRWLTIKEQGKSLGEYLLHHNIASIGIYGLGMLGNHLLRELHDSPIQVVFAVDRKKMTNLSIPVLSMKDSFPKVDAVVVTVASEYEKIRNELTDNGVNYVLSIEEILFDV